MRPTTQMKLLINKLNSAYNLPSIKQIRSMYMKLILSSPRYSYFYALDVLKGPFPEGEAAIAKCPDYAFNYARGILKGRFELGEPAIAKDEHYSYSYAKLVIHDRFPLGEKVISNNSFYNLLYVQYMQTIGHMNNVIV